VKELKEQDVAAVVLILTPHGIPLVRDPTKPAPLFWKLPGGHGESGEDARACAIREVKEETGLVIKTLEELEVIEKSDHTLTVFKTHLASLTELLERGNDGEEVRVFTPSEIARMQDFLPNHHAAIRHILLGLIA